MLLEIWLALFLAGILTSASAFVFKRAALYTALSSMAIWAVVGIAALDITVISNGETMTVEAPAVTVLAVVNALVSLVVAFVAATGHYGDESTDDGLGSATGSYDPDVQPRDYRGSR